MSIVLILLRLFLFIGIIIAAVWFVNKCFIQPRKQDEESLSVQEKLELKEQQLAEAQRKYGLIEEEIDVTKRLYNQEDNLHRKEDKLERIETARKFEREEI